MVATSEINRLLPSEILEKVFHLLPPRDLKVAVLVCRRWREVCLSPCLWSWVSLRIDSTNIEAIPRILNSGWIWMVKKIRIFAVTEELLFELARCEWIRSVIFQRAVGNISTFDPSLLACLVAHLEEMFMYQNPLTSEQSKSILNAIAGDSKLKTLNIEGTSFEKLDPDLVARAVTGLEEAHMSHKDLTVLQIEAIFERIVQGKTRLKRLYISGNNLTFLKPNLMALAISQLEKVHIGNCLTHQQVVSLFSLLHSKCSNLRTLHIFGTDLCTVDPQVLAKGISSLEEAWMQSSTLTNTQVEAIFSQSLLDTRLKVLLIDCIIGIVEKELLLRAGEIIDYISIEEDESADEEDEDEIDENDEEDEEGENENDENDEEDEEDEDEINDNR